MPVFSGIELATWTGGEWLRVPPSSIDGVSNDTRTLADGDIYFAFRGPNFDGHDFVDDAFGNGACAAVVSRAEAWRWGTGPPVLAVEDPAEALRRMAAAHRRRATGRMIAVTGSTGKSSVRELIVQVLGTRLRVAGTPGNWNNDIGLPLSILRMGGEVEVGVFEIGTNRPGEIAALCRILAPTWTVVTNVGPAHFGFFGSLEAIADEKADALRCLPADGTAFLWAEDEFFDALRSAAPCRSVDVSTHGPAAYVVERHRGGQERVAVREEATGEEFVFQPGQRGDHHAVNAALAIAVARECGLGWGDIKTGLDSYRPLPMRGEELDVLGALVVNDAYNANPLSMRASIRSFGEGRYGAGRKWLVLGDMLELGDAEAEEHASLGRFVACGSWDGLVVVGDRARSIAGAARESGFDAATIFECDDPSQAAAVLASRIAPGDAVLLKASRGIGLERVIDEMQKEAVGDD